MIDIELKTEKDDYMNREYYEKYVKERLGIPYVSFKDLNIDVIECIVQTLEKIFRRYPALTNNITAIGDRDNINYQYNLVINSSKFKKMEWDEDFIIDDDLDMMAITLFNKPFKRHVMGEKFDKNDFMALIYFDELKHKTLEELDNDAYEGAKNGYNPLHCCKFEFELYHEVAHILDYTLGLRSDKEFVNMIRKLTNKYKLVRTLVSDYATLDVKKDPSELIADAFSEYMMTSDYNYLVGFIGNYIDYKYDKYEHTKLFRINDRYIKHREKAKKYINK